MAKRIFISCINLYKKFISPALPKSCKHMPTCSSYAQEAIEEHGALRGVLLGAWRVLRCNPLSKGGLDPVPLKKNTQTERPKTA